MTEKKTETQESEETIYKYNKIVASLHQEQNERGN